MNYPPVFCYGMVGLLLIKGIKKLIRPTTVYPTMYITRASKFFRRKIFSP